MFHASWNAISKRDGDPEINLLGIMAISSVVATLLIPFFGGPMFGGRIGFAWGIGAGLCEAGYMVALAIAFEKGSFSLAYIIMRGGAMIMVWIISTLTLHERFTALTGFGILFILVGLIIANFEKAKMPFSFFVASYLCAAFIASYHLCYGLSLAAKSAPLSLFALATWIAVPIFFVASGKDKIHQLVIKLHTKPFWLIAGGTACAASFVIFLFGLRLSGAGYAISMRNTSILFAQIFAVLIGERVTKQQWIGAIVVMVGACLISF